MSFLGARVSSNFTISLHCETHKYQQSDTRSLLYKVGPWGPWAQALEPGKFRLLSLISLRKGAGPPTHLGVASWRVLAHEKAADRLPPNHYDLDAWVL